MNPLVTRLQHEAIRLRSVRLINRADMTSEDSSATATLLEEAVAALQDFEGQPTQPEERQ